MAVCTLFNLEALATHLGILDDDNLNWQQQINNTGTKLAITNAMKPKKTHFKTLKTHKTPFAVYYNFTF